VNDRNDNHCSAPVGTLSDRVKSLRLPDRPDRSGGRTWLPWTLCVLLVGLSAYLGLRPPDQQAPTPSDDVAGSPSAAAPVQSSEPPAGRVVLEAGGYVIPVHRVQVSPKVGGEVVELRIEEGQAVQKGEVIARLERSKYEFEYRRMQALADQAKAKWEKLKTGNREEEKKQAEAALREAEQQRNQLRDEAERYRTSRTAASAEELVRIRSRLSQAEFKVQQLAQVHKMMQDGFRPEEIEEAEQAYRHAVAQSDSAKYDLDQTEVIAPVSGIILVKRAEVGNTVRPEAFSNGLSASLCEMADLRELEVDVDVSERDLNRVFVKQRCEIRTEAFPDKVYKGFVDRLMPEANRSKASVSARVRIEVPEDDHLLRPEMRARVTFLK
jgi:HlyD family secretion protein